MLYLNEHFLSADSASIHINDRGFLLGDGLFETLLATNGKPQFLADHWQRLVNGSITLDINIPLSLEKLQQIIDVLLQKNDLTQTSACIRITVTRGNAGRGILPLSNTQPTILINAIPWKDQTQAEYKLVFSNIIRNEQSPLSQIKSLNYLDNILAKQQAIKQNADEAILLNTKGFVTGTTCANLFVIKENIIFTPHINDGALPGIIRKKIFAICLTENITILEKSLSPNDLLQANEIFLTNSLIGIKFVSHLNNMQMINKYTQTLKAALNAQFS